MVHRGFYAEDNPAILDDDEGSEELALVNKILKRVQKEKVRPHIHFPIRHGIFRY
jgi:hypothetical protein